MSILADCNLVVLPDILHQYDNNTLEMLGGLMGNEIFIDFCKKHKERTWEMACELDPLGLGGDQAQNYLDTMKHLRRVANLWDNLYQFAIQSKEAKLVQAAQQSGQKAN